MALFNEARDLPWLLSIALIIAGMVGLRLTTATE
jgi:multidrug transporter EmrE-like cation transporter